MRWPCPGPVFVAVSVSASSWLWTKSGGDPDLIWRWSCTLDCLEQQGTSRDTLSYTIEACVCLKAYLMLFLKVQDSLFRLTLHLGGTICHLLLELWNTVWINPREVWIPSTDVINALCHCTGDPGLTSKTNFQETSLFNELILKPLRLIKLICFPIIVLSYSQVTVVVSFC